MSPRHLVSSESFILGRMGYGSRNLFSFEQVNGYFLKVFPIQTDPRYDISKINAEDVFNPVVPLFEEKKADEDKDKYQEEISP